MTIEYSLSEQDYINFVLFDNYHSKHAKSRAQTLKYGLIIKVFVMACICAAIIMGESNWLLWACVIITALLSMIWLRLFPRYYESMIVANAREHLREGKNNDFLGPQKLTLKDDCIEAISCDTTAYTKYSAVERIGFGSDCIFIYIGAIKAYAVPLSAFSDEDQKKEFIEILKQKSGLSNFDGDVIC